MFQLYLVLLYIATLDMEIICQALSLYPICSVCYKYKFINIDKKIDFEIMIIFVIMYPILTSTVSIICI